ncbi:polyhydroxyalkanoate depolymerase [Azospirillum picis]|uniref:Poly(3-hydroxybutyrate) depolymerase n=1 Tax=Azospirillum picis TaxID=488438 RepID=A0ABU0MDK8_9PROT|nr:polyhydroxyalkanoate depolymerase [Azospirillum picis]MBP2297454.1 poly(3-hydroxybutyrate) depolymerase [Azospirillum picis]MDQ0531523.1 poly(3-hydroxybutyrate) depolymerase [Azospirillum picis]
MLYHLYDMQHAAMRPMRFWAEAAQQTFQNPLMPLSYTKLGRAVAAGAELLERTTRRFGKPAFGLGETVVDGQTVPVTERFVWQSPFCNLLNFAKPEGTPRQPRVLLVAPMSGHHATLLRGTAEALMRDHDVFITDWIDARLVPLSAGRFDLDDYIDTVAAMIRFLGPNTHVIAVCQPAVPVMAAVSLMAAADEPVQARTMTLMGGPIDPMANPTVPVKLAVEHPLSWFERSVITTVPVYYPGAFRRVYPGFIQLSGFMSMNLDRHINEHVGLFRHLVRGDGDSAEQHRRFYDEYLSVMDLSADFYLQTIETVFQKHALPNGTMVSRGRKVEPAAVRKTAVMTVEGELDDISAPGQTIAAHRLCSSLPDGMRKTHFQQGVGHYGIFNGRRWRESILPEVRSFIRSHDSE